MKNLILQKRKHLLLLIISVFSGLATFAQEKALDVNVDINKGDSTPAGIMSNPLYIIIGVLVLLLIIALIFRGGKK